MPHEESTLLGEGVFGKAELIRTSGHQFVRKTMLLHPATHNTPDTRAAYFREAELMKRAKKLGCHPYTVCLRKAYLVRRMRPSGTGSDKYGIIEMDYIPNTYTLSDWIEKNWNVLTMTQRFLILKHTLLALAALHKMGIVHKDLRTANLLINPDTLHVTIIDLGMSCDYKQCVKDMKTWFVQPKTPLQGFRQLMKDDLVSIGQQLTEMFTSHGLYFNSAEVLAQKWESFFATVEDTFSRNEKEELITTAVVPIFKGIFSKMFDATTLPIELLNQWKSFESQWVKSIFKALREDKAFGDEYPRSMPFEELKRQVLRNTQKLTTKGLVPFGGRQNVK